MKKSAILLVFTCLFTMLNGQDIPEHISYTRIYDFLDELATDGFIELNSVAKPYSRNLIAQKLQEAFARRVELTQRQQKELDFFRNEFALEMNNLPDASLKIKSNKHTRIALVQPAINYRDTLFRARITPILGMHVTKNGNGTTTKRWYGADFQAMMGKHLSVYGNLRDISVNGVILARPTYLNDYAGYEYKESAAGGDFSDSRGGIKYDWQWGSVGLVKDNVVWGDNYHGSNILSGRTPSFPMLTLHLKPAKWFELQYFHGWLVSNEADSTRYYLDNDNGVHYRMANKFIAANMFTFTPVKNLDLSFGNSIVYAEANVQPAYFIPIAFYKSIDHTLTKGLGLENQNSQVFFNISSRNIKHLHLFTSVYFDEIEFSRFSKSNPENNPMSVKVGANLGNFPLKNLSVVGEFTRTNIINYKHSIPTLTWASNGYNLGSYLGDNSQEIYLALRYKPIQGFDFTLSYMDAKHGNEYEYKRGGHTINKIISQPVLDEITWSNKTIALKGQFEIVNNVYALLNLEHSNIRGFEPTSTQITGEDRRTAQGYLDLYTPAYLQGKNTTFTFGLSFGF
ncbi:MAG TPA: capsule assembly Wzi family protein [Paludibacter sp.]|nr:capsule assembly Wzi family protein [Paludibacter sp.]